MSDSYTGGPNWERDAKPQAASAGALSAEVETKTGMFIPIEQYNALFAQRTLTKEQVQSAFEASTADEIFNDLQYEQVTNRLNAALAAHDQKVRNEVLEEVAQLADKQSYPYHSFFADEIRALVVK